MGFTVDDGNIVGPKPGAAPTQVQRKSGLDPVRYTVRAMPGLLATTKAWAACLESERPLAAAIEWLRS
jgi:hypothetical protein